MLGFECKKIWNRKKAGVLLLLFVFSLVVFLVQLKGVENGSHTSISRELYQEIREKDMEETGAYLEAEKELVEHTLERKTEMEEAYRKGEVSADEYIEYRDLYHMCNVKGDVVFFLYDRFLLARENNWQMVFDPYYNKLLDMKRISWGLLLSVILIGIFPVACEPKRLRAVIKASPAGKKTLWKTKLQVVAIFSGMVTFLQITMEYLLYIRFCPIEQLSAPAQSIACLSGISLSITIGGWMILWAMLRLLAGVCLGCAVFCGCYFGKK